jgi:hypothetical protein
MAVEATPWFTQDPRTLPEGRWRVEEHILYTPFEESLVASRSQPLALGRKASSLTLATRVRYGARDNLTVFADVPWVRKRLTATDGSVRTESGLGDLMLLAKYEYHDDRASQTRRAVALSLKPRTGDYRELPGLLATGSGTTDWALLHLWEQGRGDSTWYASLGYVLTGTRSDVNRDPGDVFVYNLAAEHRLGRGPWQAVWELNGRHEQRATEGGVRVAPSGASLLFFTPGLQYLQPGRAGRLATFEAGLQIPVLKTGNLPAVPEYTLYAGGYAVF